MDPVAIPEEHYTDITLMSLRAQSNPVMDWQGWPDLFIATAKHTHFPDQILSFPVQSPPHFILPIPSASATNLPPLSSLCCSNGNPENLLQLVLTALWEPVPAEEENCQQPMSIGLGPYSLG